MNKFKLILSAFLILNLQTQCVKRRHSDFLQGQILTAAKSGDVASVKDALKQGVHINVVDEFNDTPLIAAIINRHKEIVELLVKEGADIDHLDDDDETPLINALQKNETEIAKYLIEQGANVNHKSDSGYTAMLEAVKKKNGVILNLLLEKGAEPCEICKKNDFYLGHILDQKLAV